MQHVSSAALRKRRHRLVGGLPPLEQILRGSLIETYKRCGRPNCHCVDGPGHGPKRYLSTISRTGERPRVGYVPNAAHAEVREFLANFRKLREVLNEICAINAELLRRGESLDWMDPAVAALDIAEPGAIPAHMIESYLAGGAPPSNAGGADHDDLQDCRSTSVAPSLHLHSSVDNGAGPLQPGEHRAPVQSGKQGTVPRL